MGVSARLTTSVNRAQVEFELARRDFHFWLNFWHFKNRETGEVLRFDTETLWPGQQTIVKEMTEHDWIILLKAGKLGATELECAFDGWRSFAHPNARVHLFSKDQPASFDLLTYVKFGITHLPERWGVRVLAEIAGGDSSRSLKFVHEWCGEDDQRTVVSYPARAEGVAIDQSATHSHVDELAHMPNPKELWESVSTTIAPGGTCHIVSRGAGENHMATLFRQAQKGSAEHGLHPIFVPFTERPGRDEGWRASQEMKIGSAIGAARYAPRTAEDALQPDLASAFVQPEWWDACKEDLPPLEFGDRMPLVIGVDAATTGDCFAIVVVSRHPVRHDDVAVRRVRIWDPRETGAVDYDEAERFLRFICGGGHVTNGKLHPVSLFAATPECEACQHALIEVPGFNVVQIAYDPYQLESMMQRLRKDAVAWCEPFSQGQPRLIADRALYDAIVTRSIAHDGNSALRQHILNAGAQVQKNEDSKMRLIKLEPQRKIDAAVATSMARDRCTYLRL